MTAIHLPQPRTRRYWRQRALTCENTPPPAVMLPGRHLWPATAERWRGVIDYYLDTYGGARYQADCDTVLDRAVGIVWFESGGIPDAVSRVEWIGTPPPGYDPDDPAARASGLFQHVPAYWAARSGQAGWTGHSPFDVDANVAVACYLLYASWPTDMPAPHWHHWSGAHVGVDGSYEKARKELEG